MSDKPATTRMERAFPWILGLLIASLVAFLAANELLKYRGARSTLPGACKPALLHVKDANGKTTIVIGCAPEGK